jgi:hypothetical protein
MQMDIVLTMSDYFQMYSDNKKKIARINFIFVFCFYIE